MNEDDERKLTNQDWNEIRSNRRIENYFSIEFVAIPPDFDIVNFLSLREQAGIFKFKKVDLGQVKKIAMGVQHSPVFAVMNNTALSPSSCMYFLSIVNELGLVLKSIHNPMRKAASDYMDFIEHYEEGRGAYIRGQEVDRLNFIIVNMFPMMAGDVIDESMTIAQNLQKYQAEVEENMKSIGNLD